MPSFCSYLEITNNTGCTFIITISEIENFDWDGVSRPDNNFQNVAIAPRQSIRKREELNRKAKVGAFRMRFTSGSMSFSFRGDQKDALREVDYRYLVLDGASCASFQAIQHSSQNVNYISICDLLSWRWMARIPDHVSLTRITIPGTHDSGTFKGATGIHRLVDNVVRTQSASIRQQLAEGIRFLDIRCRHISNVFTIHHGPYYVDLTFRQVLQACRTFLQENPTETILLLLKKEHTEENNTRSFAATFQAEYAGEDFPWYRGRDVPQMRLARGKIVLLSREPSLPFGFFFPIWRDDASTDQPLYFVQDHYNLGRLQKLQRVNETLESASCCRAEKLFLNYASCVERGFLGIPIPIRDTATGVNSHLRINFPQTEGSYGTLIFDFHCIQLVRQLILANTTVRHTR
eukprot:gene1942-2120_t